MGGLLGFLRGETSSLNGLTKSTPPEPTNELVGAHNLVREHAGLDPLSYDPTLAGFAKRWGEYLRDQEGCTIRHPTKTQEELTKYLPNNMGQNLYVGHGWPEDPTTPEGVVRAWYDECEIYDPKKITPDGVPHNFKDVGHFTQVMWKSATKVGCAEVDCPKTLTTPQGEQVNAKGTLVVCNYDSGNVSGEFDKQVVYTQCPSDLLSR